MKHIALILGVITAVGVTILLSQATADPTQQAGRAVERAKVISMKIRIKIGKELLTATMLDTETSRDFISLLPLRLRLTDYARAEKIGELSRRLSTSQAPRGYVPSVGDVAYYSPWGNVAVFYKEAGYAEGLIKLGSIDEGIEKLAVTKGDFDMLIEAMD